MVSVVFDEITCSGDDVFSNTFVVSLDRISDVCDEISTASCSE